MIDVELKNITKAFSARRKDRSTVAVDNVSLQVQSGEFFALLGPSGCGKTTTLRIIAGFEKATSGELLIRGKAMQHIPPFHRPVNTVFQDYALFPHMSVLHNVMFGLEMERLDRQTIRKRAHEMLELVRLDHLADRKPTELSGGQQQRVALARALVKRPAVLLLDEPLGALDLKLRKAMQFELKEMQTQLGITFIYVTHDQEEALTMADRIAVMDQGRVLQVGTPDEIYENPHRRFVADFIGETNFLTGEILEEGQESGVVRLRTGHTVGATLNHIRPSIGSNVTIAIRPEKLSLLPTQGNYRSEFWETNVDELVNKTVHDPNTTLIPGILKSSTFIGTDMRHCVQLGLNGHSVEVIIRTQNFNRELDQRFEAGQQVYVYWMQQNARVLVD